MDLRAGPLSMNKLGFRGVVLLVAGLNLSYFFVEIGVALAIKSVSLFADSVDFLEDTSINLLIALAVGWSPINRSRVGMALAGILLIPSMAALWQAWQKFLAPVPPSAIPLSLTGTGALIVNFSCALLLTRFRSHSGSLTRGAFLSARNDVIANVAIIVAGVLTAYTLSGWPDLIVGLGIVTINAGAAREVWNAACVEHAQAKS
jgi:Co/Zn/Cd efflux system component